MIKRVKIKNFRSLDIDVALDPVTVLVGRSGAGKSNFVDAMRHLRNCLRNPEKSDNSNIAPLSRAKDSFLEYEISFDVSQIEGTFLYAIKISYDGRCKEEKLLFENDLLFHRQGNKWLKQPAVQTNEHNNIFLPKLKGIQKVSIAHIALSEGIGCYDFPGDICTESRSNSTETFKGLYDTGKNINSVFGEIRQDLTRLDSWNRINDSMRFLNNSIETIDQDTGAILVTHRFGNDSMVLNLSRESEGCRRFFAYLLAFHQSPPKQTMIFEEPEKGLYPAAFAALAEEMQNCPTTGQGQVILTTHSPELLNSFSPESIRVVVMENGLTKIGPIATDQMESLKSYLLRPGELLTVDDARMAPSVTSSEVRSVTV